MWLVRQIAAAGEAIPAIYMSCGTRDTLYPVNVQFRDAFRREGADVTWDEGSFGHEWDFWDQQIRRFMDRLPFQDAGAGISSGNVGI